MRIAFVILTALFLAPMSTAVGTTWVVNKSGLGDFKSISEAITQASSGDTIKVLPGNYDEQLNISRNVVIMGSGYEVTKITSNSDPTIVISAGKIMWFGISSNGGNGIKAIGGVVTNCVIRGCTGDGIQFPKGSTARIINCCILQNNNFGISAVREGQWYARTNASSVNSICRDNGRGDFTPEREINQPVFMRNYTNGRFSHGSSTAAGNIDADPRFVDVANNELHLSDNSPCRDAGSEALSDPDGSRSDMGYFGGPDAPIHPVVTDISFEVITKGRFRIRATGKANW